MIFTFYSYKGGVGRSMALAAVANVFAKRGLKVLAVDFDLEAPGLERYFFDSEGSRLQRAQPGLIDLIKAYRRALSNEAEFDKAEFKRWDRYRLTAINTASSLGGSVDLMTAGAREPEERMREYALAVRSFDWQDFFYNWKGDQFFDWLRRQWTTPGSGYDVVLIDSRTGVTEMGGVCAYQLADAAVLLSAPNYQNLDGTRAVVSDFRSNAVTGLRNGRELQILVVPARVEQDHPQKDEFLAAFEREIPRPEGLPKALADAGLDYRSLAIPYMPAYAVGDRLVGGDSGSTPLDQALTAGFEKLADALTLLAPPDSPLGRQQADALERLGGGQTVRAVELAADTTRSTAGFDIFLDYSMANEGEARRLRDAIENTGRRVFMAGSELEAGRSWSEEIRVALEYSETLFYCLGSQPPSEYRVSLLAQARSLGRTRIVPVLFEGADHASLRSLALSDVFALDLSHWPEPDRLDGLLRQILHHAHLASQAILDDDRAQPYPGAAPYGEDDNRFFAGREEDIQRLKDVLLANEVVFLQGAAKVGKTSLLRAGLIPRFRADLGVADGLKGNGLVLLEADRPNGLVLDDMTTQLFKMHSDSPLHAEYPNFLFIDGIDNFPEDATPDSRLVRIRAVLDLLQYAGPGFHVLLAWRGTLTSQERAPLLEAVGRYRNSTEQLEPLSGDALRRAVEEPARRARHLLEPGLTERLIESAGQARNAIFQIQLVLAALWPERRRGWLTNKSLDALGHLGGYFKRHLEACLARLDSADREAATVLFKTLSRLNPSLKLVPESQPWPLVASIPAIERVGAERLRDWLAHHGLIDLWVDDGDQSASDSRPVPMVALVRQNPMHYLGDGDDIPDAPFFMWRGQFATYVQYWDRVERTPEALLSGAVLAEAEGWHKGWHDRLTESERSLIEASLAEQDHRRVDEEARTAAERDKDRQVRETAEALLRVEQEKSEGLERERLAAQDFAQRKKRQVMQLMGAVFGALLMLGLAVYAFNDAASQARLAASRHLEANGLRLAAESLSMMAGDNPGSDERALLQLLAAHRTAPGNVVSAGLLSAQVAKRDTVKIIVVPSLINAIAISPDDRRIVSGSDDNTLRQWDAQTGQPIGAPLTGHKGSVFSVAYSPDGRRIVSGSGDKTLRQWDVQTGQPIGAPLAGHENSVISVAYSPDGRRIVSGSDDNTLRQWDAQTGQSIGAPLIGHENWVRSAAYSPDGRRIVSGSDDQTLRQWDAQTGQPIGALLTGHAGQVSSVAYSPDGRRIVSGSADQTLRQWDAQTGQPIGTPLTGHEDWVWSVAYSPDGRRIVSGSWDQTLRQWDAQTGQPIGTPLKGHEGDVNYVAFSPDGRCIVSASGDGTLRLWDAQSGQSIGTPLNGHEGDVNSVAFSPDGRRIVSGSRDKYLRLWDTRFGQPLGAPLPGHKNTVYSVAFSPDGRRIVSTSADNTLRLWDAQSHQPIGAPFRGHEATVYSVDFSPDGQQIVSGSLDNTLRLWDAQSGQPIGAPLKGHEGGEYFDGGVYSVAFSPDGRRIVSGGYDNTLRLWDAQFRQPIGAPLKGHKADVNSVAFSPDGRRIVSGSGDNTLHLWDAQSGQPIGAPLLGHEGDVNSVAFSPDGRRIVSGSRDKTLRLWDAQTGQPIGAPLTGHENAVLSVAYSPDGRRIVSGSQDKTLRIWPAPDAWPDELCAKLTRNMSRKQWREWVSPDIDYACQCPGLPIPSDDPISTARPEVCPGTPAVSLRQSMESAASRLKGSP